MQRFQEADFSQLEIRYREREGERGSGQSSVSASWVQLTLPFESNAGWRSEYRLFHSDFLRIGMVLEDLDAVAADVAYRYVNMSFPAPTDPNPAPQPTDSVLAEDTTKRNVTIVTAAVDSLSTVKTLRYDASLQLEGYVSHVGRSSLEVTINLSSVKQGNTTPLGRAYFVMVARDPHKHGKASVPPLHINGPEEARLLAESLERRKARTSSAPVDFDEAPPTAEESTLIHLLFNLSKRPNSAISQTLLSRFPEFSNPASSTLKPPRVPQVSMESTIYSSSSIMHSQNRNLHGKIFGGFLMRIALEIAWLNAYMFAGSFPELEAVDDIVFLRPVDVGSLLHLVSQTVYCAHQSNSVVVSVAAEVEDPVTRAKSVTNTFYFTFRVAGQALPRLVPNTYEEALKYLKGRRAYFK